MLHSLFGFVFVLLGGYGGFEKMMKTLVGVMGFSILVCAALTFHDPAGVLQGTFVPTIPSGAGLYVLSIIGGIGGSVTMLSYNYWMREEKMSGPEQLGYVRGDITIAYLFTALFGMAIMMTATGVPRAGCGDHERAAVTKMAEMLGSILGAFGRYAYSIGFWAAVFASLLGVWQSVPYLYADFYSILKKLSPEERARVTKVTSTPYRLALVFVTLAPIPFAFTGQPLEVIVIYTIVGSLFVPFLAATLLYLNNRVKWRSPVPHNNLATNALLVVILALFAIVGGDEAEKSARLVIIPCAGRALRSSSGYNGPRVGTPSESCRRSLCGTRSGDSSPLSSASLLPVSRCQHSSQQVPSRAVSVTRRGALSRRNGCFDQLHSWNEHGSSDERKR